MWQKCERLFLYVNKAVNRADLKVVCIYVIVFGC